jgi:hypothetical protein
VPDEVLTRRKQGFGMGGGGWLQERPELTCGVVATRRRGILARHAAPLHGTQFGCATLDRWIDRPSFV